ncbi:MAG: hypothetical protein ABI324_24225 [Ktedonobacteraceae bacterium]
MSLTQRPQRSHPSPSSDIPSTYFHDDEDAVVRPAISGLFPLKWFNGLPSGKHLAVGWHIEAGVSQELDLALQARNVARYSVLHRSTGNTVEYWGLETASLILLSRGTLKFWEMKQDPNKRIGIAYAWLEAKRTSKVALRCFIHELLDPGPDQEQPLPLYTEPFEIQARGYLTDSVFEVLEQHYRLLAAYDRFSEQPVGTARYYGFSQPIGPANQVRMVGREGARSPILPMVSLIPSDITPHWLKLHLCPPLVLDQIRGGLLATTVRWSLEKSQRMLEDTENEPEAPVSQEDTAAAPTPAKQSTPRGNTALLIQVEQIKASLYQQSQRYCDRHPDWWEEVKRRILRLPPPEAIPADRTLSPAQVELLGQHLQRKMAEEEQHATAAQEAVEASFNDDPGNVLGMDDPGEDDGA